MVWFGGCLFFRNPLSLLGEITLPSRLYDFGYIFGIFFLALLQGAPIHVEKFVR